MKTLKSIFQEFPQELLSSEAEKRIFVAFRIAQQRILRRKFYLSIGGSVFSVASLSVAGYLLVQSFLQSEFWTFLSLLFSDLSVLKSNLSDFSYLLLETFPTEAFLFLFLGLSIFFWCLSFLLSLRDKGMLHFQNFGQLITSK